MWSRHRVATAEANEALADPARLLLTPDPASLSGLSTRTIGWAESTGRLLTVITLDAADGTTHGVNGWESSPTDRHRYEGREEGP